MAQEFRFHDIGEGLTDAEIVRWLVPVGGTVAVDQPIVEVETDKAVVELPCPFAGTVLRHGAEEGQRVTVGDVLVVVGEPGDAAPIVGTLSEDAVDLTPRATGRVRAMVGVRRLARQLGVELASVTPTGGNGHVRRDDVVAAAAPTAAGRHRVLSPVIRRLAGELGVDPGAIDGSGPGGRVTRQDVVDAAAATPGSADGGDERRPMSALRRAIAANISRSWSEIPQVTAFDEADATRLLEVRAALRNRTGASMPVDALVVAAVLPALRAFPEFNATVDGTDVVLHRRYDIGIAVGAPDGLVVAVLRNTDALGLQQLAAEIVRVGEAARARRLRPDELTGQTFTVSNIGAVGGGGHGTPIVPIGTTAILSVGRASERPVVRDGAVVVAPVMPLSLSYDHRVIDGAVGRRFLSVVRENLTEPALCLA